MQRCHIHGISLEKIVLYEVVGEPACLDNIIIIPAFYDVLVESNEENTEFNFSLRDYMNSNNCEMSEICHEFYKFSEYYLRVIDASCDAIWVRAKIPAIFNYYPPSAICDRYSLLEIPFLAIIHGSSEIFPSLHPFVCVEDDLAAGLEFCELTNPQQRLKIANTFWNLLLEDQGLADFEDTVLGDHYDDYASVVMGCDFVAGYQNNGFYLEDSVSEISDCSSLIQ